MKPISKNQFDLYMFFTRTSLDEYFVEELEWYINDTKTLWAVICLDKQDHDYTVIISARDKNRQIRSIDVKIDFLTLEEARKFLEKRMEALEAEVIEEEDFSRQSIGDLFKPISKKKKLTPLFEIVSSGAVHSAARNVINEIMPHFFDVDHNFVEQFQTQGFDARLWELYLFCYFNEEGLKIDRSHYAPDFYLSDNKISVGVEAVIVASQEKEIVKKLPSVEELFRKKEVMPAKWGSPLYSKLQHSDKEGRHYWEYEHTKNRPFVIAIADFHETFSMTWSQNSLITYLYGREITGDYDKDGKLQIYSHKVETHQRENNREPIPSGFFYQEGAENVSAVLQSSCATISKFNRIGKQCGLDEENILMYRIGTVYNPDPNASKPLLFQYLVTEENSEPWYEGVMIFHNPNAKFPLPKDFFPNAAQCYLEDELIATDLANPIVFSSITYDFVAKDKLEDFIAEMERKG